jgi:hypothetical protein
MPVESSRHYRGPGLGESIWNCPSCGAENQGPIPQGCALCGAGKPGYRVEAPPPPPPRPQPEPAADEEQEQLGPFDRWALAHPQATLEDAFTAGYTEGVRAARQGVRVPQSSQAPGVDAVNRTMIAALIFFRDQVLLLDPEPVEVTTGEWLTAVEVTQLISRLSQPRS